MCLKNGFIISGTEKYENPIFIYVLIICDSPNIIIVLCVSTQFRAYPFERALFSALNRVLLKN